MPSPSLLNWMTSDSEKCHLWLLAPFNERCEEDERGSLLFATEMVAESFFRKWKFFLNSEMHLLYPLKMWQTTVGLSSYYYYYYSILSNKNVMYYFRCCSQHQWSGFCRQSSFWSNLFVAFVIKNFQQLDFHGRYWSWVKLKLSTVFSLEYWGLVLRSEIKWTIQ